MSLRFGRDLLLGRGRSKFDMLGGYCARWRRDVTEGDAEPGVTSVVQCGDGRIVAPDGYRRGKYIAILHDAGDGRYDAVVAGAAALVAIGFAMRGAESFPSFPLDDPDLVPLPIWDRYDAVVGGAGDIGGVPRLDGRVLSFNGYPGDRLVGQSIYLVSVGYRSARRIYHAGTGAGTGYLGALAFAHRPDDTVFVNGGRPDGIARAKDFARSLVAR